MSDMGEGEQREVLKPNLTGKALELAGRMGFGKQAEAVVVYYEKNRNEVAGVMMGGLGNNLSGIPEGSDLDKYIKGAEKLGLEAYKFGFPNRWGLTTFIGGMAGLIGLGGLETFIMASRGNKGPGFVLLAADFIIGAAIANHFENPAGIL